MPDKPQRTTDERIDALTMNLELMSHDIAELKRVVEIDAENIRALANIAGAHQSRIEALESDRPS